MTSVRWLEPTSVQFSRIPKLWKKMEKNYIENKISRYTKKNPLALY